MREQTQQARGAGSPGGAGSAAFREQGAPGLRLCTWIKTAAVRYAW